MRDTGIRAGKEQALTAAVCPPDEVWRASVWAPNLEHLAVAVVFTDAMPFDHDVITHIGVHAALPFRSCLHPARGSLPPVGPKVTLGHGPSVPGTGRRQGQAGPNFEPVWWSPRDWVQVSGLWDVRLSAPASEPKMLRQILGWCTLGWAGGVSPRFGRFS